MNNPHSLLFAPVTESPPAGGVVSSPGTAPLDAPSSENFYSSDLPDTSSGDAPQNFADPAPVDGDAPEPLAGDADAPVVAGADGAALVEPKQSLLKLDPETIAELRRGLAPATPTKEAGPAPLSTEQIKQMLNPVEVTMESLQSMGFENPSVEQIAGFQQFSNAVVKNAVSIARVMIQQQVKTFEAALSPLTAQHAESQEKQTRQEFYDGNKDLLKYDKIVRLAAKEVNPFAADGSEKTKEQIYKEVAVNTKATLQSLGIKLESLANPGAVGGGNVPQPNKFAPTGRSGGDNNGQRGKPNSADADIYQR